MAQRYNQSNGVPGGQSGSHFSQPQGRPQQTSAYSRANYGGAPQQDGYQRLSSSYRPGTSGTPGGPGGRGPKKKMSGMTIAAIVLMVVGVALLVSALVIFLNTQKNYQVGNDEYASLSKNVTEDSATKEPIVDFATLQSDNPEVVGWVQIPGTQVNYPVAQHTDNDYYLDHTFTDQENLAGSIFLDYRSDPALNDRTTVIYGHHLKNGAMFARIADYSDQAEFDTLSNLYYVTSDDVVHELVPLSCFVVDGSEGDSLQFSFADDASFASYVQSLLDRSSARAANATAQGINHVYLLSTCSYARDNDRTILVAVDRSALGAPATDASQNMQDIKDAADQAVGVVTGVDPSQQNAPAAGTDQPVAEG